MLRRGPPRSFVALVVLAAEACTCERDDASPPRLPSSSTQPVAVSSTAEPGPHPRTLYLPDASRALESLTDAGAPTRDLLERCPEEMVDVAGRVCVDRYEASLVDARQGRPLSPYYHPTRAQTRATFVRWQRQRLAFEVELSRSMPLPVPPAWQMDEPFEALAQSRSDVTPNGYLNATVAREACARAGKRLCTPEEWTLACQGERREQFPYGPTYRQGVCNVFGATHPAARLHGDASAGHLDPRLNQVEVDGAPVLAPTGHRERCASRWGDDAIHDMVGNLDEWVDDPEGTFLGGFYARNTREGCLASVSAHPVEYFDYSLGTRCCRAPGG